MALLSISVSLCTFDMEMASAAPTVSMKMKRNNGTDMGDGRIEGDWTITGTSSSEVTTLALQFNNENVTVAVSNELVYRFNTNDYAYGETNITLIGWDIAGNINQQTEIRVFMSPSEINQFLYIVVGSVSALFGIIIVIALIKKKKEKTTSEIKKGNVSITEI
jgi:hypothetical protein